MTGNLLLIKQALEVMKLAREVNLTATELHEIDKAAKLVLWSELDLDSEGMKVG